jgi:hypothetical protein
VSEVPPKKCRIVGDRWSGASASQWSIEAPTHEDLDRVLGQLDAETYTMVTLHAGEGHHLAIGGGRGQYVVYATFDNERFWSLVRGGAATGTIVLNAGGQEGDYAAEQVVDQDQARGAAHEFLETGQLDPKQQWRE